MAIRVEATELRDVLRVEVDRSGDERGFFMEAYHRDRYFEAGIIDPFVQDNHSRSVRSVLRGIHLQDRTAPMGKLVRCSVGAILDVAVDLRVASPTFGKWISDELTEDNSRQLYLPPGFGHGFLTLSDSADVQYKCTNVYTPASEITVAWNDPQLAVDWGEVEPIVSDRDAGGMSLRDYSALPTERRF